MDPLKHRMQNITVQAYYKDSVLGALEEYAAMEVNLTEKHKGQLETDLREVEQRRQEKYLEKYLEKLASKEKNVNASLNKVTNNYIRFSFLSLIIRLGDEVG